LCSAEDLPYHNNTKLFLDFSSESELDNKAEISFYAGGGPGFTDQDPMVLVYPLRKYRAIYNYGRGEGIFFFFPHLLVTHDLKLTGFHTLLMISSTQMVGQMVSASLLACSLQCITYLQPSHRIWCYLCQKLFREGGL
jgi:hypothetical protein